MDQQSFTDSLTSLHWVDQVGLGITALCLALGFWRGLWWQVVRLLGLGAAVGIARWVGPVWGDDIHGWTELPLDVAHGLGWVSAFLLTLIGAAILGMVGNRTIEAMKLSLINRSAGAIVGAATGALLHCAGVWACAHFAAESWRVGAFSDTWTFELTLKLTELLKLFPAWAVG